jgi:isopropylmalate/homocitrate/citramalate synthase
VRHLTLGFPGSSSYELQTIRDLARLTDGKAETWCLSRMRLADLQAVHETGVRNVVVFLPGSDIHLQSKLGISLDDALRLLERNVLAALGLGLKVRFALEDASRTPLTRLERFASTAINCGVSMLTLADTCGVLTPTSTERLFAHVRNLFPDIPLVAHCHDDLGLATANSIAAAVGGANFVQGTLGGLGERAGNAPLEELAAILVLKYAAEPTVNLLKVCTLARNVLRLVHITPPNSKPLLGSRVFAHESGIHVHGLLRDLASYEPFPPELIGRSHEICYGKHSGLSSIQYVLEKNDLHLSEHACRDLLAKVRLRAADGHDVTEIVILDEARRLTDN